jgi:uncharacterized protein DUF6791/ThiF family protein
MSSGPISRSEDLRHLRDEGYEIETTPTGMLLVRHVPYVDSNRTVRFGVLACPLCLEGDKTIRPDNHVVRWAGDYPCNAGGVRLTALVAGPVDEEIFPGIRASLNLSQKPIEGFGDYYEKMVSYVRILGSQASALDAAATAQTWPLVELAEEESVFHYQDSASGRAGISELTSRLGKGKVAVVGLGGTGSYVLDLLAKTPVGEIHLYDSDHFLTHNAFRSPGAPSLEELRRGDSKVQRFGEIYSKMRRKIFSHATEINGATLSDLQAMDFVFLCIDRGVAKQAIIQFLNRSGISFIDSGMDVEVENGALDGLVRITTGTRDSNAHIPGRISFSDDNPGPYPTNIQIAELNALNAVLAVLKWKKLWGFYVDGEREHNSTYSVSANIIINDDREETTDSPSAEVRQADP